MESQIWYQKLIKPTWAPPSYLFGPVWTALYIIIAITFGYVVYLYFTSRVPAVVIVLLALNLFFNFIFTPIQFGLRNNMLASVDISLILVTLVGLMVSVLPYSPLFVLTNIPYLLWVCFATFLQFTITYLNR